MIQAGFGLADLPGAREGHPGHRLRLRLADRALSSTNPLLAVAATLVELVGGRVTATDVLDLASAVPVRRRFGFTDDDLAQLAMWVEEAAIRWGLDAGHRSAYGLRLGDNTWESGLSRILLGVTMAEHEDGRYQHVGDALPVDDVSSNDIDLAGRFGEYVDRLRRFVDAADAAGSIGAWVAALSAGVEQLTDVPTRDAWLQAQFDRELSRIVDSADGVSRRSQARSSTTETTPLLLADVRQLLAHRLGGRPTRSNFRTGTLTVCTMVPMRSVPHRVVCLLGLDDGVFPRAGSVDGDDVLARNPMTGERDVRSEDRQLFLDAILAAEETLVVTYTGANEHTGAERPPAVPLGELLDALDRRRWSRTGFDRSRREPRPPDVRERVVVRHPLQPFDARNLAAGELVAGRPFSFDTAALAGARAMRGPRAAVTALVADPLPPRESRDVALADLQAFVAHPVRAFLRQRLDVTAPLEAEETLDAIPITLDGLAKWQIGDRMLNDILAGTNPYDAAHAERLRGGLPPGALGDRVLTEVDTELRSIVIGALKLRQGQQRTLDIDVDLGDGRRLTGTVGNVWGNRLVNVSYSRLAAKHRLASWVDLLALSVGRPDESWTAHAIGRGRAAPAVALAGPLDHRAEGWLRDLVDLYDRGMREPLPLPVKTACAYAEESQRGGGSAWKARKEWETDRFSPFGIKGEDADPSHVQAFGEGAAFEVLTTPPRDDEQLEQRAAPARPVRRTPVVAAARRRGAGGDPVSGRTDQRVFDICGPLPTGTTLLEASAGTGKTWTIGALVTRFVAEGVATLDEMLVVTFGRAASQELRERVRTQLVEAERALADPGRGAATERYSDLLTLLLDATPEERAERRQRLREALGSFDGATIATTHQFCHLVLRSLGVAGDTDANATLVEDLEDLLAEVVDDLYLQRYGDLTEPPPFSHADALRLARSAAGDPQARLEPSGDDVPLDSVPGHRVAFARAVREELDRRKRRLGVLSYDDLLSQLADALADEQAPARQRMRRRWKVVLVDEFQDTDPVQWQVLDRAFTGHATMVLIGDPKQAIYAFRGGDVTTYLQAAETATTRQTLGRNWRSDAALVDSLQVLLGGAALGDERIVVRDVDAHHPGTRLAGAGAPFRLRVVRKDVLRARKDLTVGQIRPHLYADVARDIKRLLTSGATFDGRPLQPRDVAVIAYKNNDLQQVQAALAAIGVPAVVAGSGSVFATPAATEWLRLRRGAGAAAPVRPGAQRRADVVLRVRRPHARRRGRRPHRPGRGDVARLGGAVLLARGRRRPRGRRRRRPHRPGARPGRRRTAAHRPAPRRPVAPRARERRTPRPGRDADLAARPDGRRQGRGRLRPHPPPRQRRRGRAAGDHPRQQGPGVPRRLPADPVGPVPAGAEGAAVPLAGRGRRPPLHRRRRRRAAVVGQRRAGGRGGRRRVAAAALRRDDPGPLAGGGLVGAGAEEHALLAAAADALRAPPR